MKFVNLRAGVRAGLLAAALAVAGAPFLGSAVAHASAAEYRTADGYAFGRSTEADGNLIGFTVTDDGGIGFWSEYQRLGGRGVLGAAISDRFTCGQSVCEAFEQALLRWNPVTQQADPVAVLDQVHAAGSDGLIQSKLAIPPPDTVPPDLDSLHDSDPELGGLMDNLGDAWQFVVGAPEGVADTQLGRILRGSTGAAVAGPSGAYILGAGAIAVAAGMVPDSALQMESLPPSVASVPTSLWIPRIGLNKPLTATDPDPDGFLPPPAAPGDVVWYTSSAMFDEGGTMVLAGHVDWVTGGAAFFHLSDLQPGDDIWIGDANGDQADYQVVSSTLDAGDSPAVRQALTDTGLGTPNLTLVTCGGPFDVATRTYLQRLVVQAQRIS